MAKRIVVIEDEPEFMELIEMVLSGGGYEVIPCDNGREAIDIVKSNNPDLIILDVMLPGMDGHAIATLLSQDESTCNIPIIVMTALEHSKALFEGIPQVKAFSSKLFTLGEFLEKVEELVGTA